MQDWAIYLTLARLALDVIRLVQELVRAIRTWLAKHSARSG